jgi:LuxR family maltose regulon positive regulatory protein
LMPTYLTFPEMGDLLFLSRHTVKSHAMSLYRKLGAETRRQLVERACSLGYLPPSAVPRGPRA